MGSYPVQNPGWRPYWNLCTWDRIPYRTLDGGRIGTCAHGIVSRTEPWMEAVLEPVHMGSYPVQNPGWRPYWNLCTWDRIPYRTLDGGRIDVLPRSYLFCSHTLTTLRAGKTLH